MPTASANRTRHTPSRVHRVKDWIVWEFGRRIEVTLAIRLITIERFFKATVLIAGGLVLLIFGHRTNIHQWAEALQDQLNLSPGRGWWRQLYQAAIARLTHLSSRAEVAIAIGAILYGLLEAFEGFGLLLRRRWAEYLVLLATAAFLPIEIEEMIRKPTVFKAGALLVNLVIIGYLIWRKRLFLERPSHVRADETEPVPPDLTRRTG
ncbi:MAG TPA: DUF2127 domain-containing protein [Chloroflexota bacterium]